MNLNYNYRQISCFECITISSGCSCLQIRWNNEVICIAALLAKVDDGDYYSHFDFTYFVRILYHCSNF